jgi:hypothetical protein
LQGKMFKGRSLFESLWMYVHYRIVYILHSENFALTSALKFFFYLYKRETIYTSSARWQLLVNTILTITYILLYILGTSLRKDILAYGHFVIPLLVLWWTALCKNCLKINEYILVHISYMQGKRKRLSDVTLYHLRFSSREASTLKWSFLQ